MAFVAAFINALLGTALVGLIAKFAIESFTESRPARFGGFCIALGFALGRYSFGLEPDGRVLEPVSAALGALLALAILWRRVVRAPPNITETNE